MGAVGPRAGHRLKRGGGVPPPPSPTLRPCLSPRGIPIPQHQPQPHLQPPETTSPNRFYIPCDRSTTALELPRSPPLPFKRSPGHGAVKGWMLKSGSEAAAKQRQHRDGCSCLNRASPQSHVPFTPGGSPIFKKGRMALSSRRGPGCTSLARPVGAYKWDRGVREKKRRCHRTHNSLADIPDGRSRTAPRGRAATTRRRGRHPGAGETAAAK